MYVIALGAQWFLLAYRTGEGSGFLTWTDEAKLAKRFGSRTAACSYLHYIGLSDAGRVEQAEQKE